MAAADACRKTRAKEAKVDINFEANVLIAVFVLLSFFFVRFLVFELWSILYFIVVNSVLELDEKPGRVYCEICR